MPFRDVHAGGLRRPPPEQPCCRTEDVSTHDEHIFAMGAAVIPVRATHVAVSPNPRHMAVQRRHQWNYQFSTIAQHPSSYGYI
eukprot:3319206-Pyramimonas_sp.AAC.1